MAHSKDLDDGQKPPYQRDPPHRRGRTLGRDPNSNRVHLFFHPTFQITRPFEPVKFPIMTVTTSGKT